MIPHKQVGIGGLEVARPPQRLKAVLGSCVGIVLHDPRAKLAGLAHAILPSGDEAAAELGKFADQAVDNLVVRLMNNGASKNALRAKLVGGAHMFGNPGPTPLGARNVESARQRLEQHGIPVVAETIGGRRGRKLSLDPETGAVEVEIIGESATVI